MKVTKCHMALLSLAILMIVFWGCEIQEVPEPIPDAAIVTGQVIDAKTKLPLRGASVEVLGVATTRTDVNGEYQVSPIDDGEYRVIGRMNRYLPRAGIAEVEGETTSATTIPLVPIQSRATRIGPDGGTAFSDPDPRTGKMSSTTVPDGALNQEIDITITDVTDNLPVPLPEELGALRAIDVSPDGQPFEQSVNISLPLPLGIQLPPGTTLDLLLLDEVTEEWGPGGVATITADGVTATTEVMHFSTYCIPFDIQVQATLDAERYSFSLVSGVGKKVKIAIASAVEDDESGVCEGGADEIRRFVRNIRRADLLALREANNTAGTLGIFGFQGPITSALSIAGTTVTLAPPYVIEIIVYNVVVLVTIEDFVFEFTCNYITRCVQSAREHDQGGGG